MRWQRCCTRAREAGSEQFTASGCKPTSITRVMSSSPQTCLRRPVASLTPFWTATVPPTMYGLPLTEANVTDHRAIERPATYRLRCCPRATDYARNCVLRVAGAFGAAGSPWGHWIVKTNPRPRLTQGGALYPASSYPVWRDLPGPPLAPLGVPILPAADGRPGSRSMPTSIAKYVRRVRRPICACPGFNHGPDPRRTWW
jgi:hypothetical protein